MTTEEYKQKLNGQFIAKSVNAEQFDHMLQASYHLELAVDLKDKTNADVIMLEQLITRLQRIIDFNMQKEI